MVPFSSSACHHPLSSYSPHHIIIKQCVSMCCVRVLLLLNNHGCCGYGDSHGDSHGNGYGDWWMLVGLWEFLNGCEIKRKCVKYAINDTRQWGHSRQQPADVDYGGFWVVWVWGFRVDSYRFFSVGMRIEIRCPRQPYQQPWTGCYQLSWKVSQVFHRK